MQDWLGLDNSARINKPSTVGQNWRWRLKKTQLTKKLQKEICQLTTRYGRMNWA
ncbi:MAG: 4-alpha-glucanotransferase [Faecalibacterium sp.]|jgi:4-alpha-glucanotransferase